MLNLEPIKARLAAASPGPWRASNPWGYEKLRVISAPGGPVSTAYNDVDGCNNADFIAAAPQDMAALIAEVERLRKEDEENINKISELQERNDQLVEENITLRNTNAARPAATVRKRILG